LSYNEKNIKNVLVAGHSGSGKTSLVEALLFKTGKSDRQGRVEDGNTAADFDPEEIKRGVSLSSAVVPLEHDGAKINCIDVPGLFDFELGMYEGIMAAEAVLIAVSARDGLQVGAIKAFKLAQKAGKSHMFYVSKLDVENADFYKVFEEMKAQFGPSVCPVVVPVTTDKETVYIDLVDMKSYKYEKGVAVEMPMPATGHRLDGLITAISEAVAETDETLFEKYFSGEQFTKEEMRKGIYEGVKTGAITPVVCGVATKLEAMDLTLDALAHLLPSAGDVEPVTAENAKGEAEEIMCSSDGAIAAYVFKTVADPFVGKLSYVKVLRGTLKPDSNVVNNRTGSTERLGKLIWVSGKKQTDTPAINAGDIGAITKLTETKTGDILCAPSNIVNVEAVAFPTPTLSMALRLKQKGDEGKISSAMQRLMEEDGTLFYKMDNETLQQIMSGLGEQHLDVVAAKLKAKFGIEVELTQPRVAYRETIRKKIKAEGKHKKQTGGHGQFGHVIIEFEPVDSEELVFEENVFGGSVPRNFFPAVEKGLRDSIKFGVLAGYPMVGLKATLLDGSYHPVDSSEMAFKLAAGLAYRTGLKDAGPVLLEPISTLKAYVPDSNTGDLMGEVNKRRGRVLGMNPAEDNMQVIEAECPTTEMYDFTTYIRSLTQGRGYFTLEFARYEQLPQMLESKVIEEAKKFIDNKAEEE